MDDNKWNIGQGGQMPIGFGLNLAANDKAMQAFSSMSDEQKAQVVNESRQQQTKDEMERFVSRLGDSYR